MTGPDQEESSDLGALVNLPGVRELREAVANARRRMPKQKTLRREGLAGLTVTIASVPDGMAGGLLAGVNPIYGLYASMIGPIVGGVLTSTRLMVINNTSAVSLVAGQALVGVSAAQRESNLFLMVILSGIFAVALGLLGQGRITRFVSYSVMTGFVAGIAAVLVLSQLATAVGYSGEGANRITQTLNLLSRLDEVNLTALMLAILAAIITVILQRTPLRAFSSLLGIVVPTLLVVVFGLNVQTVQDIGTIPDGFPLPELPSFASALEVVTGAISVAVIALVQGAGVSQTVPNPDGSRSRASRDFVAQGAANIASGLFHGLPVGGSLSATALNVAAGARDRWAAIFSGLWMAVIVIGAPGLVSQVAMPALAGLLILIGLRIFKPKDFASVWRAGWPSRSAGVGTFVATLVFPIQIAVALGVAISTLLYVSRSSTDVTVVELVERPDGRIEEREPAKTLATESVTVLDVYGHLFFAGVRTLERLLPLPDKDAIHPVVILRLRGRATLGATLEEVLANYADKLEAAGGRLYLTGLSSEAHNEVVNMAKLHLSGPAWPYPLTPIVGESTQKARDHAEAWLVNRRKETSV